MKTVFVARSANDNTDCVHYSFNEREAVKKAWGMYDHLTDKEKTFTRVSVESYNIDVPRDDNRTACELSEYLTEKDPDTYNDLSKTKPETIKKYSGKLLDLMGKEYRSVLESNGSVQYKIYIWEDGETMTLLGAQGDTSYIKKREFESRNLYYVTTIDAPFFNPWDYSDHGAPEDEIHAEKERGEIIDSLVEEYEMNAIDILNDVIWNAEHEERMHYAW